MRDYLRRLEALPPADRQRLLAKLPPLSYGQQRLWLVDRLQPERGAAYNVRFAVRLAGPADTAALKAALEAVVLRHTVLRTVYPSFGGVPYPIVAPSAHLEWEVLPRPAARRGGRRAAVAAAAEAFCDRPFDLAAGPVIRAACMRLGEDDHLLLVAVHHIACDDASVRILLREVGEHYGAAVAGRTPELPPLPLQYADFASWQRQRLRAGEFDSQIAYWKARLDPPPAPLALAHFASRSRGAARRGASASGRLDASVWQPLRAAGAREGATPFLTLLTGFAAYLHRRTGQTELAVGTPITHRTRAELEPLIGYFSNTLVLPLTMDGDPCMADLLRRVRSAAVDAYAAADVPFDVVMDGIRPARPADGAPLFQVMFTTGTTERGGPEFGSLAARVYPVPRRSPKFDLSLHAVPGRSTVRLTAIFAQDVLTAEAGEQMLAQLATLLGAAAANPRVPLSAFPLLPPSERRRVMTAARGVAGPPRDPPTVHLRIEECVRRAPDTPAVLSGDRSLSLGEVQARAIAVHRDLAARGVGRRSVVPVVTDGGVDTVPAVLGILRAGAAFLPVDANWPRARIDALLQRFPGPVVADDAARRLVDAGRVIPIGRTADTALPPAEVGGLDPVYVIATSGTTGEPRCVTIPHAALANRFDWMTDVFGAACARRILWTTPPVYDSAVWQMLWPLTLGGATVHAPRDELLDARGISAAAERHGVTLIDFVPSVLKHLLPGIETRRPAFGSLRAVVLGGEALSSATLRRLRRALPRVRIFNLYGPTEATIGCIAHEADGTETDPVPIGRPISGTCAVVVDDAGHPCGVGVAGELLVGGRCLALGYHGDPAATRRQFVDNPFPELQTPRLYRTGDLARTRPDGSLEFLGRRTDQIKVRGVRIEPEEVERALRTHAAVTDCAVVAHSGRDGLVRLVAYFVAESHAPAAAELLRHLRGLLPAAYVPSVLVPLAALPRAAGGKLDRRTLALRPLPVRRDAAESSRIARTPTEHALVALWCEVLGIRSAHAGADFFALGGESLLAVKLVARIRERFEVDLPLRAVFDAPTPSELAAVLDRAARSSPGEPAGGTAPGEPFPLSHAQRYLWDVASMVPGLPVSHIRARADLRGALDLRAVRFAVRALLRRHDALRTGFGEDGDEPVQRVSADVEAPLRVVRLRGRIGRRLDTVLEDEAWTPFDLALPPLFRLLAVSLPGRRWVLLLTIHHIVADGESLRILGREFWSLYEAGRAGKADVLPPPPAQYADFVAHERAWLAGPEADAQRAYWRAQLAEPLPRLTLVPDGVTAGGSFRRRRVSVRIDATGLRELRRCARRCRCTLFTMVATALKLWMARTTGVYDTRVGIMVANRSTSAFHDVVGLLTRTLVLRTRLDAAATFPEALFRVRAVVVGALDNQALPLAEVLPDARGAHPAPDRGGLFPVLLQYERVARPGASPQGLAAERARRGRFLRTDLGVGTLEWMLTVAERQRSLVVQLEHDPDLFPGGYAERALEEIVAVLQAGASSINEAGFGDARTAAAPVRTYPEAVLP